MIPQLTKRGYRNLWIGRTLPFEGKVDHLGQKSIYYIPLRQGGME
jgi:hypothetical protein